MAEPTLGMLDTSVVIDHDIIDPALLPDESAISAVTLADLLIASTAAANGLPLYTRNPSDFAAVEQLVRIVAL